ncbi:la-related protein 6-like [Hyalella azteca]|uniref:La-related protein 6-like n=1 Tax=Hyalella azteca TaxID=294128 RepID=A0A979FIT4_HYAAZ|nr:la-related protein 6-like [Hyalella azteca]
MSANIAAGMAQLLPPIVFPENLSESDLDLSSELTSEGAESTAELEDPPSAELLRELVDTLDYYFGDESLAKDLFLLKHIKRQPEGYVSLKLLAGYKKVKKLSRNWRVVALAAKKSTVLVLNETGTRVKRKNPLPPSLAAELPASKTLMAINVPEHLCSIEQLATRFASCGPMAALQLIKPGQGNPPELVAIINKFPGATDTTCAVVEFEDVWGATKALQNNTEPTLDLHVIKINKRRERGTPELRSNRPFHHQMYRLLMENSHGSESSGSEGDDFLRQSIGAKFQGMRVCASTPSSPAIRRCPFSQPREMRSPRGPDGTSGFVRTSTSTEPSTVTP